jgi:hypothetical protein
MAHEILEAFLNNVPLIHKKAQLIIRNDQSARCNNYLNQIVYEPENFEIYQEPKKAWIYTTDFVAKEFPILNDNSRSGAIALAREFLKRYKQYYSEQDCRSYELLKELIGEENL